MRGLVPKWRKHRFKSDVAYECAVTYDSAHLTIAIGCAEVEVAQTVSAHAQSLRRVLVSSSAAQAANVEVGSCR